MEKQHGFVEKVWIQSNHQESIHVAFVGKGLEETLLIVPVVNHGFIRNALAQKEGLQTTLITIVIDALVYYALLMVDL